MLTYLEHLLGLKTNPPVFFISAAIIVAFVPLAAGFEQQLTAFFGWLTTAIATSMGWFYILAVSMLLVFLLWVIARRTGRIKLGPDDAEPEYSDLAWFTMLFAAGIGTVLMFWGVAEPISHFNEPPFAGVTPRTTAAAQQAMDIALYHFGLHTWTIFAMPGLAVGYFVYRKGLPLRFSSVFHPLLGDEGIRGPAGNAVDIVAVVGTMFGVATSLGLGTLQVSRGLAHLFELSSGRLTQIVIIGIITCMATTSVVLGLDKGVKILSEINILLAIGLMLYVLFDGHTVFILQGMVESLGSYLAELPRLAFWNDAFADDGWQQQWTIFYWAWTSAWAPFVGIFVARISYGRTLREFVLGVLMAPTLFTVIWFSVFGMSAFHIELLGAGGLSAAVKADPAVAIYEFLQHFSAPTFTCGLALVIIVIFFTTSSDSASLVIDMLSSGDATEPPVRQRVFWAVSEGVVAAALLFAGGFDALKNVITTIAFPFAGMIVFMAASLLRAVRREDAQYEAMLRGESED